MGFPGGSDSKETACNVGNLGSIPGSGRSPGEGNGYRLEYSGLENPVDRGAWPTVHGAAKSRTGPSNFHYFTSFKSVGFSGYDSPRAVRHWSCVLFSFFLLISSLICC